MYVIILLVVVASAIYGPHIWAKHVLTQYSDIRENLPGTDIELAEHLVDRLDIARVRVEGTELPDHYDPLEKVYKHHSCTLHITSSQGRKAQPFLFWVIVTKNWPASWLSKKIPSSKGRAGRSRPFGIVGTIGKQVQPRP